MSPEDASVVAAMVAICGEHAHRVKGLDHWYPMRSLDGLVERLRRTDLYALLERDVVAAALALSSSPLPYYAPTGPFLPGRQPIYLHALVVLPHHQGRGLGRAAMSHVDRLAVSRGGDVLRFDAATANTPALRFYRTLGYDEVGVLPVGDVTVTCFERHLSSQGRSRHGQGSTP